MIRFLFLLPVIFPLLANAQEAELNNGFRFREGIYLTFEDLKNNMPSYARDEITDSIRINQYTANHKTKKTGEFKIVMDVKRKVKGKSKWKNIKLTKVWAVVDKGKLYIRGNKFRQTATVNEYSYGIGNQQTPFPIQMRQSTGCYIYNHPTYIGSICIITKTRNSYNTENLYEVMLNFKTGEIAEINVYNIRRFIMDDKELYNEFQSEPQTKETAYYYITQYNMRNKTYISIKD